MKALSMKQPVPELILQGKKKIELRKWNTNFRGRFLIHASKNEIDGFKMNTKNLPKGALVGTVELKEVIRFDTLGNFRKLKNEHLAVSDKWFIPKKTFGFVLVNPERLKKPIEMKGKLNFFEVNL
ncbi:ASCH domain-containing protein [Candidatus Woesearchaeota archaeon]|nr:ASCH domain-containing protein [Candidatus Woesearchaeota archaeon]